VSDACAGHGSRVLPRRGRSPFISGFMRRYDQVRIFLTACIYTVTTTASTVGHISLFLQVARRETATACNKLTAAHLASCPSLAPQTLVPLANLKQTKIKKARAVAHPPAGLCVRTNNGLALFSEISESLRQLHARSSEDPWPAQPSLVAVLCLMYHASKCLSQKPKNQNAVGNWSISPYFSQPIPPPW
jgi:hypothetical protein